MVGGPQVDPGAASTGEISGKRAYHVIRLFHRSMEKRNLNMLRPNIMALAVFVAMATFIPIT